MDDLSQEILRDTKEPALPSKLEVHRELIRELRRKRVTYRSIAELLNQHFGLSVRHSTIHAFVKVRAKPLQSPIQMTTDADNQQSLRIHGTYQQRPPTNNNKGCGNLSIASKQSAANPAQDDFQFDPTKGLTLPDEVLNLKSKPKKD